MPDSSSAPSALSASPPEDAIGVEAVPADGGRRAVIRFEDLAGEPFPYPLVRARVRGVETSLIVDTGASHTVLDVWLLEQLGVELVPSEQPGEGHAGEQVSTMQARSPHLEIERWGPVPGDVLAVRLPPLFRTLGLGGVVSPQSLATRGTAVILDLAAGSLGLVPLDEGLRQGEEASLGPARACRVGGEPAGAVYVVDAAIEGQRARLIVDSGAARTDVLVGSAAGRTLRRRATGGEASYTVSGRVEGRRVEGVALDVGRVTATLDLGLMAGRPSGACPRDGHLGLDVLRRCVLVLAPDHLGARCADQASR